MESWSPGTSDHRGGSAAPRRARSSGSFAASFSNTTNCGNSARALAGAGSTGSGERSRATQTLPAPAQSAAPRKWPCARLVTAAAGGRGHEEDGRRRFGLLQHLKIDDVPTREPLGGVREQHAVPAELPRTGSDVAARDPGPGHHPPRSGPGRAVPLDLPFQVRLGHSPLSRRCSPEGQRSPPPCHQAETVGRSSWRGFRLDGWIPDNRPI